MQLERKELNPDLRPLLTILANILQRHLISKVSAKREKGAMSYQGLMPANWDCSWGERGAGA